MEQTLQDIINVRGTLEAWKNFTVKDWQKQFVRLRIGQSGESKQINSKTYLAGNTRFVFEYLQYLDFVKWGVGKGIKIDDVKSGALARSAINTLNISAKQKKALRGRVPKNWFGKAFKYNVYRLTEIMADKYATQTAKGIKVILEGK